MGFSKKVSEDALVSCGRSCCLCHTFCGNNMELHHIKQKADSGEDSFENCIPLCFNCHAIVKAYNPNHPKGKKISESELIRHRDNWYKKVSLGFTKPLNQEPNKLDFQLYNEIKIMLSDTNLEYYLSDFDLGNSFNNDVFSSLNGFLYSSNKPEFEFIDEELEKLKGNLANSITRFLSFKAVNTFATDTGQQAIKCWHESRDFYDEEDRKSVAEFNGLADEVWNDYCYFVKECRRRFANFNV
jgi:hypothetical protein